MDLCSPEHPTSSLLSSLSFSLYYVHIVGYREIGINDECKFLCIEGIMAPQKS